jgi:hypothetical protein
MIRVSPPFAAQLAAVLQARDVVPLASATFPADPDMLIGDGSSRYGVGRGAPTGALLASRTRRYCPGPSEPDSSVSSVDVAPKFPVPAALVYWRDFPSRGTEAELRLKISM